MTNLLWGIGGIFAIFTIAFLLSSNRKAINLRTIFLGLGIQIGFAFLVLRIEAGKKAIEWLSFKVQDIVIYANEGIHFLFGGLLIEGHGHGFIFAIQVLTIIIFFSSLISVLYYLGIMQAVVKFIGGGLSKLLGTSKTESLSAAANIFLGQTEAPLVVKPYINKMTQSELFAVMTGGLASVAGSVLVGYSLLGVPLEYLLAASFMAAPAGLIMAKIMVPETETKEEEIITLERDKTSVNIVDAASRGAADGLKLAVNVGGMLLAFIGLIALLNGIIGGIGGFFGYSSLSLEGILGVVFAPLAFAIGVPWDEAITAGAFIGQKIILNEYVAFSAFSPEIDSLSPKTVAIISFALTGFANLSSIAILIGGLGGMAPDRRSDIARLGFRSVIAGTLASLLSASIAGMFFI